MRVRALRLLAETDDGLYGRLLRFGDGLTVLRASNSHGKSTCLMALLYGLGLEGMVTAKRQVPLPHALTDFLLDGEREVPVKSSKVQVELEDCRGQALAVERVIKGTDDPRLVRTWRASIDANLDPTRSEDFFVRGPGAAQREAGFHYRLAAFMGWGELPLVQKFDGTVCPLYLETIFPLLFIEQKRGWLGLQARMPTYLGIREPQARVVEFLLALEPDTVVSERNRLESDLQVLEKEWAETQDNVSSISRMVQGELENVPSKLGKDFSEAPRLLVPDGLGWKQAEDVLRERLAKLRELEELQGQPASTNSEQLADELKRHDSELEGMDALAARLENDLEYARLERVAGEERATALRHDLQRNKDAEKLRTLGSLSRLNLVRDRCPTCQQPIEGHLLQGDGAQAMSLEENVEFIVEMLETVEASAAEARRREGALSRHIDALAQQRAHKRQIIRTIKRSLLQTDGGPSLAKTEERLRLQDDVARYKAAKEKFVAATENLRRIDTDYKELTKRLKGLRRQGRSPADLKKIKAFADSFGSQLEEYRLRSLADTRLSIEPQTFRPQAEGLDLEFELSGSDLIRAIWAYHLALLEAARTAKTNHPGFLIFDEPKQQGAEHSSVMAMLRRACQAGKAGQQVIVASSEDEASLRSALQGEEYLEISLEQRALVRGDGLST